MAIRSAIMLTVGIYISPTGKKAWIEDVVVDESYRGKGIGQMLMNFAVDYVKQMKVSVLMLTSNPSRIAANKLYVKLGFEKKETNVYRFVIRISLLQKPDNNKIC